ncbi:arylesterase [Sphingobium sp. H39-3-25]|uniref:arylesterase n=1 Tax=Sphingobium arseniciresistens TaxID=3030834 RepID=UPI0023B889FB|nr:arylesterase [Sphingobium arseniciresistens]
MKKGRSLAGRFLQYGASLLLVQLIIGCSQESPTQNAAQSGADMIAQGAPTKAPAAANAPIPADAKLVVVFGDSLFAGYNLAQGEGFAPALERGLVARGVKARVFNAGVSGDTSAAGLARLGFTLDGLDRKPDLIIVGLGANDMLRGLSPEATRSNLDAILIELKKRGIPAMLAGMLAAPNMGRDYATAFNPIYPDLAKKYGLPLYPFFLDGVLGHRELMLPDGMHPNPAGVDAIVTRISPIVATDLAG